MLVPQAITDTESTTMDIGGFSDTSQSLPGLNDGMKKVNCYLNEVKRQI